MGLQGAAAGSCLHARRPHPPPRMCCALSSRRNATLAACAAQEPVDAAAAAGVLLEAVSAYPAACGTADVEAAVASGCSFQLVAASGGGGRACPAACATFLTGASGRGGTGTQAAACGQSFCCLSTHGWRRPALRMPRSLAHHAVPSPPSPPSLLAGFLLPYTDLGESCFVEFLVGGAKALGTVADADSEARARELMKGVYLACSSAIGGLAQQPASPGGAPGGGPAGANVTGGSGGEQQGGGGGEGPGGAGGEQLGSGEPGGGNGGQQGGEGGGPGRRLRTRRAMVS